MYGPHHSSTLLPAPEQQHTPLPFQLFGTMQKSEARFFCTAVDSFQLSRIFQCCQQCWDIKHGLNVTFAVLLLWLSAVAVSQLLVTLSACIYDSTFLKLKFCKTIQQQKNVFLHVFSAILKWIMFFCLYSEDWQQTQNEMDRGKKRSDLQYAIYTFLEKKLCQCNWLQTS